MNLKENIYKQNIAIERVCVWMHVWEKEEEEGEREKGSKQKGWIKKGLIDVRKWNVEFKKKKASKNANILINKEEN